MMVVNEKNFQQKVLEADKLVVVDFWSTSCMPCRVYSLILDKVADKLKDKIYVYKVNVDGNEKLAVRYNIMSVPCTIFFKDGKEIGNMVGVIQEQVLEKKICEILNG